jgi:hypothetical protein
VAVLAASMLEQRHTAQARRSKGRWGVAWASRTPGTRHATGSAEA